MAPLVNPTWSLVIHMKTMHAFTAPDSISPLVTRVPPAGLPTLGTARRRDHHQLEEPAVGDHRYLEVDPTKLRLIYEAVDHELFRPGDAAAARAHVARLRRHEALRALRVFAVAVQELRRPAARRGRSRPDVGGPPTRRSSAPPATRSTPPSCARSPPSSASPDDVVWVGGVPLEETVALLSGGRCERVPVARRDVRAADPRGDGVRVSGRHVERHGDAGDRGRGGRALRSARSAHRSHARSSTRSGRTATGCATRDFGAPPQFTWAATAAATLDVYREVAERRRARGPDEGARHRRRRVHRLAHLRPAARARPRRRRARRADARRCTPAAGPPISAPTSTSTRATCATATCSRISSAASTRCITSPRTRTTCRTSRGSPTSTSCRPRCSTRSSSPSASISPVSSWHRRRPRWGRGCTGARPTASRFPACGPSRRSRRPTGTSPARCAAAHSSCRSTPERISNPQNAYGMSKLGEEMVAVNLGRRYDIPTVALRYSIVQGPRQSVYNAYSGACRIFCLSYLQGMPPTLYEDGRVIRDYVNIDDVVDAQRPRARRRPRRRTSLQRRRRRRR